MQKRPSKFPLGFFPGSTMKAVGNLWLSCPCSELMCGSCLPPVAAAPAIKSDIKFQLKPLWLSDGASPLPGLLRGCRDSWRSFHVAQKSQRNPKMSPFCSSLFPLPKPAQLAAAWARHREKPWGKGGKSFVQGLKQHPRAMAGVQKSHLGTPNSQSPWDAGQ